VKLRLPLAVVGLAITAACSSSDTSEDEGSSADAISIRNLAALLGDKVDRTTVDPYNPWAKKRLGIGEENVLPGEAEEFEGYAKLVNTMQSRAKQDARASTVLRTFHAKPHACVRGELTIDNRALPEAARVGLFAANGAYPTWARFSNGVGTPQADRKADVRGLAVKIMGVSGERAITKAGDESASTQDFLMADQTVAPASDARHMMLFGEAMMGASDTSTVLGRIDNLVTAGSFLTRDENVRIVDFLLNRVLPQSKKVGSPLGDVYYTGAPNALGLEAGDPSTARARGAFKVMAQAGVLQGKSCVSVNVAPNRDPNYFRTELEEHLAAGTVCVDISVQLQQDPVAESIEDVSVEWRTPFTPVGRLTFGKIAVTEQHVEEGRCNSFSFTPWHTLLAHRPLGNAMRARKIVLASSAAFRGASTPEPKPDGD
jgi:hypothetical protein